MRIFCWKCKTCGTTFETSDINPTVTEPCCYGMHIVRDYKAESVGANLGDIKRERESGFDPRLFLPTTKEFSEQAAAAGDPNPEQAGKRKMDKWMENHRPAPGNKHPIDPRKL